MAYKQEPCPLCGRNMTAIETYPGRGELYCGNCDLTIGGNDAKTPEELIALMNSGEHRRLSADNAKLRKLVDGLTWCCEHYGCRQECPLYDVSDPDHCLEVSIKRELGIEVDG